MRPWQFTEKRLICLEDVKGSSPSTCLMSSFNMRRREKPVETIPRRSQVNNIVSIQQPPTVELSRRWVFSSQVSRLGLCPVPLAKTKVIRVRPVVRTPGLLLFQAPLCGPSSSALAWPVITAPLAWCGLQSRYPRSNPMSSSTGDKRQMLTPGCL